MKKNSLTANKTLFLEKRGCDFSSRDDLQNFSDCENYRICGYIVDKYGRNLFVEFSRGYKYRWNNKRTGAPLKHGPIREHDHALSLNTQYDNFNGSWRDLELEKQVHTLDLNYTTTDILKAVDILAGPGEYTSIIICDRLPDLFNKTAWITTDGAARFYEIAGTTRATMEACAGWREREALDKLAAYKVNKADNVIELYYNTGVGFCSVNWSIDRAAWV